MDFEYDIAKSEANAFKHGIDFEEAQELWNDRYMVSVELDSRGENRHAILSHYAGCVWFGVYTMRGKAIRIISVRRAVKGEVSYYDKCKNS